MKKIIPKYMMATTAIHKLGDISRDNPDLCRVNKEDDKNYYGAWIEGYGFINVKFPKKTTRDLTKDEIEDYNKTSIRINNQPAFQLKVD